VTSTLTSWEYLLVAPQTLVRRPRVLPELDAGGVRVRFLYCGVCGSDLSNFEGRRAVKYPVSLGHEFIAEVCEVGSRVTGLVPGDLVTSDLNYRCGTCDQCRANRSHLCRIGQVGMFSNRAFAEFGDLHASYLLRLGGRPKRHLALSEPLSCVLHARSWANPRPEDRVLVVGAGGLGLCLAFALSTCDPPISFEIVDTIASRSSLVASAASQATAIAEPKAEYDVVFDLSGAESGLRVACAHTKSGGRLCTMSHLDGYSSAEFLLSALTRREITFTVSYLNGEPETLRAAATTLAQKWTPAWDNGLVTVPIKALQETFLARRETRTCKTVVAVTPAHG
jgi:L-iditol 2-dehydrogenase